MSAHVSIHQILRRRALATGLGRRLPAGHIAAAAWGGLQDSVPRSGVISLHARVEDVRTGSWADPSVVQIWFRGADYIVPRADVGVFTLGTYPRDPARATALERIADDIHRVTEGQTLLVAEVSSLLGLDGPLPLRHASITGRVHIRWDAANIWIIPVERPDVDIESARRELARRFLHWYGPATRADLARWTGAPPLDATATWQALEPELAAVEVNDGPRFMLAADMDALNIAGPASGVRLLPMDDPYTKFDHNLLVPDPALRLMALPKVGFSPGYIPGAVLVGGEIVGGWERRGRTVTIHPFPAFQPDVRVREAIELEAESLPIAGSSEPRVAWA